MLAGRRRNGSATRYLLDELPAPQLRTYPKYIVVAEKAHAMCLLGMANTRMKDYFDLWVLLTEGGLEPAELRRAIVATFDRRMLALPGTLPSGLGDAFAQDAAKQGQWAAFLKNEKEPAAGSGPRSGCRAVARQASAAGAMARLSQHLFDIQRCRGRAGMELLLQAAAAAHDSTGH